MSTFVSLASDQSEALLGSILFQAGKMSTAIRAIAGARFDLAQCETGLEFLCEESSFSRLGKNSRSFLEASVLSAWLPEAARMRAAVMVTNNLLSTSWESGKRVLQRFPSLPFFWQASFP